MCHSLEMIFISGALYANSLITVIESFSCSRERQRKTLVVESSM